MHTSPPLVAGLVATIALATATVPGVVPVAADSAVALQGRGVQALAATGSVVIAGTDAGAFLRNADGSWTAALGAAGSADITALASAGGLLAAGTDSGVITSRDGHTWSAPTLTGRRVDALLAVGSSLVAGTGTGSGTDGVVYRSDDLGATWSPVTTTPALEGLPGSAIQALGADAGGILAGSAGNGVFRSAGARSSWTATGGGPGYVTSITALGGAAGRTLAATDDGLFGTGRGGTQWTLDPFPQPDPWIQALVVDGTDVLAGTYDGAIYRRTTAATWSLSVQGLPSILSLLPLGGGGVLIGTFDGVYCSRCPGSGSGAGSSTAVAPSAGTATTRPGAAGSPAPSGASRSAPPVAQRPGVANLRGSSPAATNAPGASSSGEAAALPTAGQPAERGWVVWVGSAILVILSIALFVLGRVRFGR